MTFYEIDGDLLTAKVDIIAHQCNCQGVFDSGVALQIKQKHPSVFAEYEKLCLSHRMGTLRADNEYNTSLLGRCQCVPVPKDDPWRRTDSAGTYRAVANLFGIDNYGRGVRQTNYEAIYTALEGLQRYMEYNDFKFVAFPYNMSCDRGGADWTVIVAMINSVFKKTGVGIHFHKFAG